MASGKGGGVGLLLPSAHWKWRVLKESLPAQHMLQFELDSRPLRVKHTEVD